MRHIKQKLIGVLTVLGTIAICLSPYAEGDWTMALFTIPLGLGLVFSRKNLLN